MNAIALSSTNKLWVIALADMQQAQLLMVAGFVMLGWVLARRQIKMRRRVNQDARSANKAIQRIRDYKDPALPLSDAPPETQRWQAAMFDLQRELKADLDTRIAVVQVLLRQVDQRIETLRSLDPSLRLPTSQAPLNRRDDEIRKLLTSGHTAQEIATQLGRPLGDIEIAISTLR